MSNFDNILNSPASDHTGLSYLENCRIGLITIINLIMFFYCIEKKFHCKVPAGLIHYYEAKPEHAWLTVLFLLFQNVTNIIHIKSYRFSLHILYLIKQWTPKAKLHLMSALGNTYWESAYVLQFLKRCTWMVEIELIYIISINTKTLWLYCVEKLIFCNILEEFPQPLACIHASIHIC